MESPVGLRCAQEIVRHAHVPQALNTEEEIFRNFNLSPLGAEAVVASFHIHGVFHFASFEKTTHATAAPGWLQSFLLTRALITRCGADEENPRRKRERGLGM